LRRGKAKITGAYCIKEIEVNGIGEGSFYKDFVFLVRFVAFI
jgi:hypothetical protein